MSLFRDRSARGTPFLWGFVSQGASSATNFGLSLLAGIVLGPRGLGVVFIGFAAYLIVLGFQRALFTDPLVSTSSSSAAPDRSADSRAALSACLVWACGAGFALAAVGVGLGGDIGLGLVVFAPWIPSALIQDYWRVVLFRDGRGRAGAVNDIAWAVAMGLAAPTVLLRPGEWTVVSCWGVGATLSMLLGFRQTGLLPERPAAALRWWRTKGWPLGRWLAAEGIVYTIGAQALVFLAAPIVGIAALGGLRAVQTIFAPLSLLGPALSLPAFPHVARALRESPTRAHRFSRRLGAIAVALTGLYVGVAATAGDRLLGGLLGDPFRRFASLIWPVGVGQMIVAGTLGISLLLKAEGSGRGLLVSRAVASVSALGFTVWFASAFGVAGVAWGMTVGAALGAVALLVLAIRRNRSAATRGARGASRRDPAAGEVGRVAVAAGSSEPHADGELASDTDPRLARS